MTRLTGTEWLKALTGLAAAMWVLFEPGHPGRGAPAGRGRRRAMGLALLLAAGVAGLLAWLAVTRTYSRAIPRRSR